MDEPERDGSVCDLTFEEADGTPRRLVIDHDFMVLWKDQFDQIHVYQTNPPGTFDHLLSEDMTLEDWDTH